MEDALVKGSRMARGREEGPGVRPAEEGQMEKRGELETWQWGRQGNGREWSRVICLGGGYW